MYGHDALYYMYGAFTLDSDQEYQLQVAKNQRIPDDFDLRLQSDPPMLLILDLDFKIHGVASSHSQIFQ